MADLITPARAQMLPTLAAVPAAYLAVLITAASTAVHKWCKREFTSTVYVSEIYDGNGSTAMFLDNFPIIALTSIVVLEAGGTTTTLLGAQFDTDVGTGEIRFIRNCTAGYCYFPSGFQNLQANYTAGFAAVPEDIQEATAHMCAYIYGMASLVVGVKSEKLGDYAKAFGIVGDEQMPPLIKQMLSQYRNIRP